MSETTERQKTNRQWVRPGQRLRLEIDVEVLSIGSDRRANLKVLGNPTATCVDCDHPAEADSACNLGET